MPSRPRVLAWFTCGALALVGCDRTQDRVDGWDARDAWRRCGEKDPPWPEDPAAKCRVLHMCVNEAPLDAAGLRSLQAAIAATRDCPPL